MRLFLLSFILVCIHNVSRGQIAFYDAIELRSYIQADKFSPDKKGRVDSILAKYLSNEDETIKSTFGQNPFIKDFFADIEGQSGQSMISAGVSFLGNLDVTNIADGIAQFLIKRGKEELNVAFFTRMKKFLDDPAYPEAKTLFPVTTEVLGKILTSRYAELIQSLREAFHKDLSNLLISLNQLIDHPKYKELLKNLPQIRLAVRGSRIVSELSQSEGGILPDSLIHELAIIPEWQQININLGNSWKFLDIISQSIRHSPVTPQDSSGRRWVRLSDFNSLVKDKITLRIFLGLIYQQVQTQNIQFKIGADLIRVDTFMRRNVTTIHVVSGLIENFALLASDVDRTINDFRDKKADGTLSHDDYYTYINKALNIIEYGFKVANTIKDGIINDEYIVMARNANDLYKNIYTKNYNNAVMNVYTILNYAFADSLVDKMDALSASLKTSLKSLGPRIETIEKILKYGNFMASVIKAESGEEVQNALEAAALPAGSYSIKQKSALNLAVNGYIGYALDFGGVFNDLYAHGIYAPVGISVSRGSTKKHGLTFSGFVSLIDVGGIASYRLENGNTDSFKQQVRLESIFSPSAQIFVEYPGLPLAIGGGWRRTPKLFYSGNNSIISVQPKSVFNFTILVDIPLFNLVNKPFYKK